MKYFIVTLCLTCLISCGSAVSDITQDENEIQTFNETTSEQEQTFQAADVNIPIGRYAVIAAANFGDSIGSLATLDKNNNYLKKEALISTDGSDIILRSFNNFIYVINRYGADTLQVIDSVNFNVIANYSIGEGSNPQDFIVVSDNKAYLTRFNSENDESNNDDILILDPFTGEIKDSIDLTTYTNEDSERYARATQMVLVDGYLYVCVADLPLNLLEGADTNGKVVVIDTNTDQVIKVIELESRNPADITYSPLTNLIYVSSSGVYENFVTDITDSYGGIEIINPDSMNTLGVMIDDFDLGGCPTEIRLASETLGYVVAAGYKIVSFDLSTYEVINTEVYLSDGMYVPDFSIDENSNLYITERDANNSGIVILNENGEKIAGPIPVGALPASITFIN